MKRRAFISVYDKTGLEDFARNLSEKFEYEIVASEDTYNVLKQAGIEATNVSEYVQNGGFLSKEFNRQKDPQVILSLNIGYLFGNWY